MTTAKLKQKIELYSRKRRCQVVGVAAAATFCLSVAPVSKIYAGTIDTSGAADLQIRYFPDGGAWQSQDDQWDPVIHVSPEFDGTQEDWTYTFRPKIKIDIRRPERSEFDVGELSLSWEENNTSVQVGMVKTFWGVTESRHLVDIINQSDLREDMDGEDKFGQAMISIYQTTALGDFELIYLPLFRDRKFPSTEGRLRLPARLLTSASIYDGEKSSGWRNDLALRYSKYLGSWDVGVHLFCGLSREPRFVQYIDLGSVAPVYDNLRQIGLDLQYTGERTLYKLELIGRDELNSSNFAAVGGIEHTFYGAFASSADVGILIEYLYDGRRDAEGDVPVEVGDNDIFIGSRVALNDVQDTQGIVGVMYDLTHETLVGSIELSRRIGEQWTLEIEGRWLQDVSLSDPLYAYQSDSNLTARVAWRF